MTTIAEVEDLVRRHEIDAALEELGRMMEERPDDAEASMLFGVCQQMKGRTESFCEIYRDLAPSMSVREAAGEVSSTVTRWRHYRNVAAYLIALGIAVFVAGGSSVSYAGDSDTSSAILMSRSEVLSHDIVGLVPECGSGFGVDQILRSQADDLAPAPTAEKAIDDYLATKDWGTGYDEEKDRIVVKAILDFDIKNPKVSTDFIKLRKAKMDELCLIGKAKIIEGIMSKMSGSRILEIPGNPIAKQLEKENEEMNKALKVAKENLERLDKDLAEALALRDDITASELVAVISSWFTKADKENLGEKLDAQKKADYNEAKNLFLDAEKAYKDLAEKAEAVKGTIKSKMKTSISSISEMPIYGCTVLQQAESITRGSDGKYKYQIAILYAWSGEMMDAAGKILMGEEMKFKPGKRNVKQWINSKIEKGAIAQWIGPHQYIDNQGNMWFLGISATPVMDDADDNNEQREIAELQAKAEVMFSLYADARSSKRLETLTQTKVGANGAKECQTLEDYAKEQSEAFDDIMISGNTELYSGTVRHAPSGLDIHVVIYGVNSGRAKTLRDINARAVAMGININAKGVNINGGEGPSEREYFTKYNMGGRPMTKYNMGGRPISPKMFEIRSDYGMGGKPMVPGSTHGTLGTIKSGFSIEDDDL